MPGMPIQQFLNPWLLGGSNQQVVSTSGSQIAFVGAPGAVASVPRYATRRHYLPLGSQSETWDQGHVTFNDLPPLSRWTGSVVPTLNYFWRLTSLSFTYNRVLAFQDKSFGYTLRIRTPDSVRRFALANNVGDMTFYDDVDIGELLYTHDLITDPPVGEQHFEIFRFPFNTGPIIWGGVEIDFTWQIAQHQMRGCYFESFRVPQIIDGVPDNVDPE